MDEKSARLNLSGSSEGGFEGGSSLLSGPGRGRPRRGLWKAQALYCPHTHQLWGGEWEQVPASGAGTSITGGPLSGWHLELKRNTHQKAKTFHPWFRGLGDQPPPRQEARAGSRASGAQAGAWGEVPAMDTWPVGVHMRGRRSLDGSRAPAGSHTPMWEPEVQLLPSPKLRS